MVGSLSQGEKTLIVGLGHRAQQGKDTAVAHIIETFGPRPEGEFGKYFPMDIRRYAFADELKIEVFDHSQGYSFLQHDVGNELSSNAPDPYRLYSKEEKLEWVNTHKTHPAMRHTLQVWGTEFRRKQDPDYWVKKTLARIKEEAPQVALITDMRFPNEAAVVDVTVKVVRPGFESGVPLHSSETQLDDFNFQYILEANNIEELQEGAETLFVEILEDKGLLPRFALK